MTERVSISELAIPSAVGADGWDDFVAAMGIHFGNEALAYRTDELAYTPAESLPTFTDVENQPTRLFVARDATGMIGVATYEIEPGENPETVWLKVDVLPRARNAGVGAALSDKLQGIAATDGVRKAIVYTVSPDGPGERLESPTGFGSLPRLNPEVRFLLARDYRLEQVVRGSRLALPTPERMLAVEPDPEFRIHSWTNVTPPEWLDEMARLRQLMSVEEPNAGLGEPEDVWTPERLRDDEQRQAVSPRIRLFAAAEHVSSRALAGFTVLSVPVEIDRAVSQEDTLVRREFRGHRLGMRLKLANLATLQQRFPGHPSVTTFNAEENRHMLDVNESLGFVPLGYEGAWRKDLPR